MKKERANIQREIIKKVYCLEIKDLRKSFPKWTMIAWALIDLTLGVGLIWLAISWAESTWAYYLLFIGGLLSFRMCYVHLSYLWGGKIWDQTNEKTFSDHSSGFTFGWLCSKLF